MRHYIAYLHKESDSDFGVSFPDFPGCVTAGETLEEAHKMAAEALALHIEGMKEEGLDIPAPASLDDLVGDPALKEAIAFMVPVNVKDKTVRFNVTALESELLAIDAAAGGNRSAFIVRAALQAAEKRNGSQR